MIRLTIYGSTETGWCPIWHGCKQRQGYARQCYVLQADWFKHFLRTWVVPVDSSLFHSTNSVRISPCLTSVLDTWSRNWIGEQGMFVAKQLTKSPTNLYYEVRYTLTWAAFFLSRRLWWAICCLYKWLVNYANWYAFLDHVSDLHPVKTRANTKVSWVCRSWGQLITRLSLSSACRSRSISLLLLSQGSRAVVNCRSLGGIVFFFLWSLQRWACFCKFNLLCCISTHFFYIFSNYVI